MQQNDYTKSRANAFTIAAMSLGLNDRLAINGYTEASVAKRIVARNQGKFVLEGTMTCRYLVRVRIHNKSTK